MCEKRDHQLKNHSNRSSFSTISTTVRADNEPSREHGKELIVSTATVSYDHVRFPPDLGQPCRSLGTPRLFRNRFRDPVVLIEDPVSVFDHKPVAEQPRHTVHNPSQLVSGSRPPRSLTMSDPGVQPLFTYTIGGVKIEMPVKPYPSQVSMMDKVTDYCVLYRCLSIPP